MNTYKRNTSRKVIAIFLMVMALFIAYTTNAFAENNDFLAVARECHDYLCDNQFYYSKGGKQYPIDASKGKSIDCSSFVGWCIYEYQDGNFSCKPSSWYLSVAKALLNGKETENPEYTEGWEAIQGYENFEPGDVLCYSGHVHIYAGPDKEQSGRYLVYNAGTTEAARKEIQSIDGKYFQKAKYAIRLP